MSIRLNRVNKCWVILRLSLVVGALALTGCAGTKKINNQQLVFWPDSDLPRVQFLAEINSNADIVGLESRFSLVAFSEPEKVQFEPIIKPTGVVSHKGKVYVCDAGRSAIFVIDPRNRTFEQVKAEGRGAFGKPLNVAFDRDDNMYVADSVRKEVMVFDSQMNFLRGIGRNILDMPTDVAVYEDYIFVAEPQKHHVKIFDRATEKLLTAIGEVGEQEEDRMSLPTHIDVDLEGFLHVTNVGNGRILKYDRDGHLLQGFGGLGTNFARFGRPRGISVDDNGRIYVVDASHQNVQIFNEQGRLLMFFGGPGEMKLPAGVYVTRDNLDVYQQLAAPNFDLESVIFVSSHFGNRRIGVYGLGKRRGIDYEEEYRKTRIMLEEKAQKAREEAEKKQEN